MVNIGIIGLGAMGQNHLRNINLIRNANLVFLYDYDIEKANSLAEKYNSIALEDIAHLPKETDAIIISSPTSTHYSYIKEIAPKIKYIFVEKPLTKDLESSISAMQIFDNYKNRVQIGFIERYNDAVNTLKNLLANTEKVINIDFIRTNKISSRIEDVDVIIDLMIHDIDLAIYLNGYPEKIQSYGYKKNGTIDYARAIFKHSNGVYSNIVASRVTEKKIRQIYATCEDMYIDANLLSKEVLVNKQTVQQYLDNISITSKTESIFVSSQENLLSELLDFMKLCEGEQIIVPNPKDALNAIKAAEEINKQILC